MNKTKRKRKFTDEELMIEYDDRLSDRNIAQRFGVSKTAVQYRRHRLGLISKKKKQMDPMRTLNKKQMEESYKKFKERRNEKEKRPESIKRRKKYMKKYYQEHKK